MTNRSQIDQNRFQREFGDDKCKKQTARKNHSVLIVFIVHSALNARKQSKVSTSNQKHNTTRTKNLLKIIKMLSKFDPKSIKVVSRGSSKTESVKNRLGGKLVT